MRKNKVSIVISILVLVVTGSLLYGYVSGFFCIEEVTFSPHKNVMTVVYNRDITDFPFSQEKAFTVSDKGVVRGRSTYETATFKNLYWSPDEKYRVIALDWDVEGSYLALNDFVNNSSSNLTARLQTILHTDERISELLQYSVYPRPIVTFTFENWTEHTGEMAIRFSFEGNDNNVYRGSFYYNYADNTHSEIILE